MIVPLSMWRDTSEDTVVGSYVVPEGTAIAAQISVIMNDEKYFKNKYEVLSCYFLYILFSIKSHNEISVQSRPLLHW